MILAAGLTPAWQQILVFDRFQPGEVNRAREAHWCASGKVLNVGLALHHLGVPCKTLSPIGGIVGAQIRQEFQRLGVAARWIDTAAPTRICTTILDRATSRTTELVENSRAISEEELSAFITAYAEEAAAADWVVLSGSLPAGTPTSFYRRLMEQTRGHVILDARGPELLEALDLRPFLVKPNREELSRTVQRSLNDERDLIAAMHELNRLGAEWVVISQGQADLLATHNGEVHRFTPPSVEAVNPIGCGDCLAAGIAAALSEGRDPLAAIRFGMAAAADNLRQLLPARLDRRRVEALAATKLEDGLAIRPTAKTLD